MRWLLALFIIIFSALQYRLWIGQGSWAEIVAIERDLEKQLSVNKRLSDRNRILETEVHDLKNGLEGIEARARSELGLVKKGETFYMFVDEKK